jgi:hypothetical protein
LHGSYLNVVIVYECTLNIFCGLIAVSPRPPTLGLMLH